MILCVYIRSCFFVEILFAFFRTRPPPKGVNVAKPNRVVQNQGVVVFFFFWFFSSSGPLWDSSGRSFGDYRRLWGSLGRPLATKWRPPGSREISLIRVWSPSGVQDPPLGPKLAPEGARSRPGVVFGVILLSFFTLFEVSLAPLSNEMRVPEKQPRKTYEKLQKKGTRI